MTTKQIQVVQIYEGSTTWGIQIDGQWLQRENSRKIRYFNSQVAAEKHAAKLRNA